jgi:hypothetical protein
MGRVCVKISGLGRRLAPYRVFLGYFGAQRNLAYVLLFGVQEDPMLQLLDLARETTELKSELTRIRHEAEALQRLLADRSVQSTSDASEDLRDTAR